jgi:2-amino-4-hydroxy-6-hydroxymethyldihydropteridine diphosphokinase
MQTAAGGERAFVALGANLGDPVRQVEAATAAIAALPRTRLVRRSSLYRTAPVGYRDQPDFINAVVEIETALGPRALLDALLAIERAAGRVREFPNAPRTLDLDVLAYGGRTVHEPGLTIPHPRLHERAFVLLPLAEIAPELEIAGRGRSADLARSVGAAGVERLVAAVP